MSNIPFFLMNLGLLKDAKSMNIETEHILTLEPLSLAQIDGIIKGTKITQDDKSVYGINTGFGSLCNTVIPQKGLEDLQRNLVLSHSCGTGPAIPNHIAKIVLLLKIKNLSLGCSGVRVTLIERLISMYNADMIPELFEMGSLGASGDLAPLAHLAATLLGEGNVRSE